MEERKELILNSKFEILYKNDNIIDFYDDFYYVRNVYEITEIKKL